MDSPSSSSGYDSGLGTSVRNFVFLFFYYLSISNLTFLLQLSYVDTSANTTADLEPSTAASLSKVCKEQNIDEPKKPAEDPVFCTVMGRLSVNGQGWRHKVNIS